MQQQDYELRVRMQEFNEEAPTREEQTFERGEEALRKKEERAEDIKIKAEERAVAGEQKQFERAQKRAEDAIQDRREENKRLIDFINNEKARTGEGFEADLDAIKRAEEGYRTK